MNFNPMIHPIRIKLTSIIATELSIFLMLSLFKGISIEEFKIITLILFLFVASFGSLVVLKLYEHIDEKHSALGFLIATINLVGLTASLGFVAFDNAGSLELIGSSGVAIITGVMGLCAFGSFSLYRACKSDYCGSKSSSIIDAYKSAFRKHGFSGVFCHTSLVIVTVLYFIGLESVVAQCNLDNPEVKNLVILIVNAINAPLMVFLCFTLFIRRVSRLTVQCTNVVASTFSLGAIVPAISGVYPVASVALSFAFILTLFVSVVGVKYVLDQDGD
ncbi:hypothetical protein [Vibrio alginolyticus]|uniref:hypothetical protein n=1 Tax=Vibrio alginolyticus TaxID=663 RepID=UPI000AC2951D|nr:hypothetical protein [Vibrio alginolyticus]CAH7175909.1 conserved membrane hypothetical protein [Vibrio chagasii]CAH7344898.1 conserved membrane hypothetical protein [Vibrio chagasii]